MYNVENLFPWLDWRPHSVQPDVHFEAENIPNVLLPALILIVSGLGALVGQWIAALRGPSAGPASAVRDEVPA
jgi:hypothetical protein